jgi:hypothetical protein
MVELLSIPLKKGADLDLVKPLKTLIASTFSTADKPENYTDALTELQRLRQLSVRCVTFNIILFLCDGAVTSFKTVGGLK